MANSAPGKSQPRVTLLLSLFAATALMGTAAFAGADQDSGAEDQHVEKKIDKRTEKRTIRIVRDDDEGRAIRQNSRRKSIEPDDAHHARTAKTRAVEEALEEVRSALDDVRIRLEKTRNRNDKRALNTAKESLEKAIEALEKQKEIYSESFRQREVGDRGKHRHIVIEREVVKEALEQLDEQAEELLQSREEILDDIQQMREELADEIADIQIEIDDGDDMHVVRLRALRDAELAISGMEKHHLAAIKAAEAELKRARKRLEKKLKASRENEDKNSNMDEKDDP